MLTEKFLFAVGQRGRELLSGMVVLCSVEGLWTTQEIVSKHVRGGECMAGQVLGAWHSVALPEGKAEVRAEQEDS